MDEKKLTVRVPAEIYELLEAAAAEDLRSANAELVYLLREALAKRQADEVGASQGPAVLPPPAARPAAGGG